MNMFYLTWTAKPFTFHFFPKNQQIQ